MRDEKHVSRKLAHYAIALVLGALNVGNSGCIGLGPAPNPPMTFAQFEAKVRREMISGMFIVDGDTAIRNRQELREFYERYMEEIRREPMGTRQDALIVHQVGGVDAKWDDTQSRNLTYCVSTTFGSNYAAVVQAMAEATANGWEIPANVHFIHRDGEDGACDERNNNVVFDVRPTDEGTYLARAFLPNFERIYRNILIDNSSFGDIAPYTLPGVLRHEAGHALGFRHEHTRPEAGTCFEDDSWRPLTTYDSDSVMHYPQCNGTNRGDLLITQLDAAGAAALYPF